MKTKKQIFLIHGGMTFRKESEYIDYLKTRDVSIEKKVRWMDQYLDEKFGKKFHIVRPRFPKSENAKYEEWKIWFERFIPQFSDNIILIGSSLGGIFLAQYLSENKFPRKILSVYLVCPPFDDTCIGEDLVGGFKLRSDLSLLEKNCKRVTLMFSADDDCVPVDHAEKYRNKLKNSKIIIYKSKNGHFKIPKFPEIVKMIKNDIK
jgi:hypothetical protein